ncbi:hypothetical protein BGW80DRAFT_1442847 [Lactifluus volemus]|nr:hypothetical protein BGW80DRAFT_1442847 [Lactifluus volemus]
MGTLAKVGIVSDARLVLSEAKRGKIEGEGKVEAAASGLSFDAIVQLIQCMRNRLMTEAGRRMLISLILLRVGLTVHDKALKVDIVPEFPVEATFETDSDKCSFSGVVDYIMVRLSPANSVFLLEAPADYILRQVRKKAVAAAVIKAEQDIMEQAIPRAALTIASYCNQQRSVHCFSTNKLTYTYTHVRLSAMRGCITSGEQWIFFIYKCPKALGREVVPIKREGEFYFSRQFNLGENLENLSLILGLLRDLTDNANQKYFSYESE